MSLDELSVILLVSYNELKNLFLGFSNTEDHRPPSEIHRDHEAIKRAGPATTITVDYAEHEHGDDEGWPQTTPITSLWNQSD